ncbi:conserved hypothetical protein [metagenome]|uniref:Putative T7SS secretion signal domain-containing protein n=1 Tax=metagenome TaxID=256318 RepID=A0A2P2CF99_9ZZZZ
MYGDTTRIRARADQLRRQATEIRDTAVVLQRRSDQLEWSGRSADAMRSLARGRLAQLAHAAQLHDTAADALERHAAAVDRLKELITSVEHRARQLVVDRLVDHFVPPLPGSLDWLKVDLPGLGR